MIFESWRNHRNMVATAIKKSRDCAERAMKQTILRARSNCGQGFRPKVTYLKHKRHVLPPRQPPSRKGDEQLWRTADNNVGLVQSETAERSGKPERCVISHALVCFAIR